MVHYRDNYFDCVDNLWNSLWNVLEDDEEQKGQEGVFVD